MKKPAKLKKKQPPVTVSFMPCPKCGVPHDRSEPCAGASVAEIVVRSSRSFKRAPTTKRVRLTRELRLKLSAGETPRMAFPNSELCPLEPGDVVQITSLVWFGVTGVRNDRMAKEFVVSYKLHHERPRLLRARAHSLDFDAIRDELEGKAPAQSTEAAAEESGYTTSTGSSMAAEPEAVPREYGDSLAERHRSEHLEAWEARQAIIREQLVELRENPSIASEVKFMETQLDRLDKKVRRGQAKDAA